MTPLFLKALSGISAIALTMTGFGTAPANIRQLGQQPVQNVQQRQQGGMGLQQGNSGNRFDNRMQQNTGAPQQQGNRQTPQNSSDASTPITQTGQQVSQRPVNMGQNQPAELIRHGFTDNGVINKELPEVTGNTERPKPDQELIEEITEENGLSQSEDYSYVYLLGNVTDEEYEALSTYIDAAYDESSWIIDSLSSNGWEIILTSADLDRLLFDGATNGVTGCTVFNEKAIYVEAGQYEYCVVHEIGHYLDYINSFVSTQDEFTEIFSEEGASLTEYGSTDRMEFFAEVFMYSILEEDTTAYKVPKAYEFVESLKSA